MPALLAGRDDALTTVPPVLDEPAEQPSFAAPRRAESIGRPLGDDGFLAALEALTRRTLRPPQARPPAGSRARDPWTVTVAARRSCRRRSGGSFQVVRG